MKLGIDIGGMSVKFGIVDSNNSIVGRHVIETDVEVEAEKFVEQMIEATKVVINENGYQLSDIESIGIGCPGVINTKNGVVVYASNLSWDNVKVAEPFSNEFKVPVVLANDADAAALGEATAGAANGARNAALLTLGTGVGSGVIIDGKILSGPLNGGCEMGHITIEPDGVMCACGNRGCLETCASATALMRMGREAARSNPESMLTKEAKGDIESIKGKLIFDCKEAGDEVAIKVVDTYLDYVTIGVSTVVNIFRPEVVILGGGVSAQKEKLTDEIEKRLKKRAFGTGVCEHAKITTSVLGNDAGIIGAALLE